MRAAIFLILCLIFIPLAYANTPSVPDAKPDPKVLDQRLEEKKQEQKRLEKQIQNIEGALVDTRSKLVNLGKKVQNNETALQSIEVQIDELESQRSLYAKDLEKDREAIAELLLAISRIRRVPAEALILKPDAPIKTAQSAMLMRDLLPAIEEKSRVLREKLAMLDQISNTLQKKKDQAMLASKTLEGEYAQLQALVSKREQLYAFTHENLQQQQQEANRIALQAKNLKDLVQKLKEEQKEKLAQEEKATQSKKQKKTASAATKLPSTGSGRLPINGVIRTAYNEKDAFGAPSQGISIEGRGGALIIAPMGGIVRFTGEFKNYGNMIIIEHKGGYHSLIAGFEKIDTVVGQNVSAGEPLGKLHYSDDKKRPALYYELRQNSKPIDPARKIGGLT